MKRVWIVLLLINLFLFACTRTPAPVSEPTPLAAAPAPTSVPAPTPTPVPTPIPTSVPTPTPAAEVGDSCLVGRWIVADFSPYFQTATEGTDITDLGISGNAWYQFNIDGTFLFEAIEFTQHASVKTDSTQVPVSVIIDGFGTAAYRVEGDKVIFSQQKGSGLVFQVEVFDERIDLGPAGLFGDPTADEVAFLYECAGTDRLLLTPPMDDYRVFPIVLERYP